MGKTVSEKILARAAKRAEVSAGEYVEVTTDRPSAACGDSGERVVSQFRALGGTRLFNPRLLKFVTGHAGVSASEGVADNRVAVKRFAREMGIPPENILDLGRHGIEHLLAAEQGWALPGSLVLQVVNGHSSTVGALGAFAFTLSYGSAAYLATGKTWVRVPQTAKFNLTGRLPRGVMARDVFEYVLGQVGPSGCVGQVMEWTGPIVDDMEMDGRFSLCSCALFTGAWTALINPDQKTIEYVKARTSEPFEPLTSDPDAQFAREHTFDLSDLEPQIVPPPERYHVYPVPTKEGTPIGRGFIGACANGRIEDMRVTASILKGRKIHPTVQLNITPGTMNVYRQCIKEGLLETFAEAGAVIPAPACGMCLGWNTPLGPGEVCVATGTCNYPGRMGSEQAEIYLASPATVAASCIEGRITDPRQYL